MRRLKILAEHLDYLDEAKRVDGFAIAANLVVHVWAGRATGTVDFAHFVANHDLLVRRHQDLAKMRVARASEP